MDDALSVSGFLDVGDGHQLYWEDWGNPRGAPVLFLHGGPGDSFRDAHKALFDPQAHRVLFFDQRGCGRSRPFACTEHNTTPRLLDDIDRLLDHVGMPSAHVAGGSWGSALALLYAISSPDRVRSLVVWGVYLIRGFDNDWVNEGYPRHHFPVEWDRFISLVPERARRDGNAVMRFYAQQMRIDDATDGV
ncbi:MAG TPA: alpha/beta fold hydrolase, partial [Nocardioides sp.]|nr:alpha/beta fold hydrolase [Nocardioides sp.]